MSVPLLGTKLFLPRPRAGLVPRDRLASLVDRGLDAKLLLVSAPAGFGKSSLMAERLSATPEGSPGVAWLTLDERDDEPAVFWTYVVAALRTAEPEAGSDAMSLLNDPHPPPFEVVLTTLLNDLAADDRPVVLVLDDYHVISSLEIHSQMAFLLDHAPSRLHVVLVTRVDPALPLSRLRARAEMVEIRAADLRFTEQEVGAYFARAAGVALSESQVAAIGGRTEGWVAALQLAALSMAGRDDNEGFVAGFAGDDRYVVDYLVEEVLLRQSSAVQDFLLQTSVLDRMTGSLCEAVTGTTGGRTMLEELDRANLFLIPLDPRRQWYRYHHLFAEVLRARLLDEQPELVAQLHARASAWFDASGDTEQAIHHALLADDADRAADLLERVSTVVLAQRREPQMRRWLESLPEHHLRGRPVLANALAGCLLSTGETEGVEEWLDAAEAALAAGPSGGSPAVAVTDPAGLALLPSWVALHRAGLALATGDLTEALARCRRTEELAGPHGHLSLGGAAAITGLVSWSVGDLESAHSSYLACLPHFEAAGRPGDVLGCSLGLADIQVARGQLGAAERTLRSALSHMIRHEGHVLRGSTDMHVGLAAILVEHDDVAGARASLRAARELGDHAGLPQSPYRWRVAMAHVREIEGDVDGALTLLDEAILLYNGDLSPNARPVTARRARVAVRHGRLAEAEGWLRASGLSTRTEPSYLREYELVTLARFVVARDAGRGAPVDDALRLLARLREQAEAEGRHGSVLDICVTQALTSAASGRTGEAVLCLERALEIGGPEGFVRLFLDEPVMPPLLRAVRDTSPAASHARALLARSIPATGGDPGGALVDPLSARELEVLRLLDSELNGPDIARHLVVSLNTVRTHTKNVYMKLGVNSRMAALRRARELDLL